MFLHSTPGELLISHDCQFMKIKKKRLAGRQWWAKLLNDSYITRYITFCHLAQPTMLVSLSQFSLTYLIIIFHGEDFVITIIIIIIL